MTAQSSKKTVMVAVSQYEEVNADHAGMVSLVLPDVFTFCDRTRSK